MTDAAIGMELVDVRGIGLDRLRDSSDEALCSDVRRLLRELDTLCVYANDGGGSMRRQD
jgi:hypothetical protein